MAKTYQRTKLQEVTIRGYKSIAYDRPVTLKLGDVSILLGANGAGKSCLIKALGRLQEQYHQFFPDAELHDEQVIREICGNIGHVSCLAALRH